MATTSSDDAKKHSRNVCSFTGCARSKARYPTLKFFSFPVNRPSICDVWVRNCANEALDTVTKKTLNRKVVCQEHFEESCFFSTLKTSIHKCAVPTILALEHIDDTPRAVNEQVQVVQEHNPIQTTSNPTPQTHPQVNHVQTPQHNIRQLPGVSRTPASYKAHSRRALFSTPSSSNTLQTPRSNQSTPAYKKFKSVKGRQQTPNRVLTPGKKNCWLN